MCIPHGASGVGVRRLGTEAGLTPVTPALPGLPSESFPEPLGLEARAGEERVRSREAQGTRHRGGSAGGSWIWAEARSCGSPATPLQETAAALHLHPRTPAARARAQLSMGARSKTPAPERPCTWLSLPISWDAQQGQGCPGMSSSAHHCHSPNKCQQRPRGWQMMPWEQQPRRQNSLHPTTLQPCIWPHSTTASRHTATLRPVTRHSCILPHCNPASGHTAPLHPNTLHPASGHIAPLHPATQHP